MDDDSDDEPLSARAKKITGRKRHRDEAADAPKVSLRGSDGGNAVPICGSGMTLCMFLKNMLEDCTFGAATVITIPASTAGVNLIARMTSGARLASG